MSSLQHEDRKDGMDITSGEDAHVNRCTQGDWKVYVLGEFAGLMMVGEPVISLSSGISSNLQHQMTLQLKSSMYTYTESNLSPINAELCNLTHISEFYLLGLSEDPNLQPILFGLFLSMYLITVLGNLLIILAITNDPHFHTPMYFFLSTLSLDDICFISTTIPKMLMNLQSHSRVISYAGCLPQMCLFIIFCCMGAMLLTVMAYDRFLAICHPLKYPLIMNPHLCVSLVLLSLVISLLDGQVHVWMSLQITGFTELEISNFFCGPSQILELSCKHSLTNDLFKFFVGIISGLLPVSGIFSYYRIISSVLRIPSPGGTYKAFSTCGSHLPVVCLFFGTALGIYFESTVSHSPRGSAVSSVMYIVLTPLLNPFIYSLRNRDLIPSAALEPAPPHYKSVGCTVRGSAVSSLIYTVVTTFLNTFIYSLWNRDLRNVLISLFKPVADIRSIIDDIGTLEKIPGYVKDIHESPTNVEMCNLTHISEFYLLGLSDDPELQLMLFGLFLSMYLWNLLIILAVTSDPHLHTPMYFFLSNLSLADIGFTSTTVPKVLVDIQTHGRAISYVGCLTHMSIFLIFGCMDVLLLTAMAYDLVAICHPLNYPLIMNPSLCVFLILLSFVASTLEGQLHVWMVLQMTNFKLLEIPSFFCDPSQVLDISCEHSFTSNSFKYIIGTIYGFLPVLGILFSYCKIISSVLRMSSSSGKYKAFSICGSHLSVVCLFFGTAFSVYFESAVSQSPKGSAVFSAMYTVVTPHPNPFIYSLRNRDLKSALRSTVGA
ncbi:LOW QUALITY PROTEIN: uncharacterized protein RHO17_009433 [Thomomys bottae]